MRAGSEGRRGTLNAFFGMFLFTAGGKGDQKAVRTNKSEREGGVVCVCVCVCVERERKSSMSSERTTKAPLPTFQGFMRPLIPLPTEHAVPPRHCQLRGDVHPAAFV